MPEVAKLPVVEPIRLLPRTEPFDDPEWTFEFKYDGFRGLMYMEERRCRVISRQGKELRRFAELAKSIFRELGVHNAILDGEVIVSDETGRPIFYDLLRHRGEPTYIAFDMLWLNGVDLRPLPLVERRARLHQVIPPESPIISECLAVEGEGKKLFALMCINDLEGIVAKRLRDPYTKRTKWYKIKNPEYSQLEGREKIFNQRK